MVRVSWRLDLALTDCGGQERAIGNTEQISVILLGSAIYLKSGGFLPHSMK